MSKTFIEMSKDPTGTIYEDWFDEGVRCLIMRGPSALCAYLGVPIDHPLAGRGYDSIPLDCHGGLTFSRAGEGSYPKGFWWFGWDYGHCDDRSFYDLDRKTNFNRGGHEWTVDEVKREIESVLYNFKRLVSLAEDLKKNK